MKASVKITLIVAACLIAAGLVITTTALIASRFNHKQLLSAKLVDETIQVNGTFSDISVDSDSATVNIVRSTDGSCSVVFSDQEDANITHSAQIIDGELKIIRRDERIVSVAFIASPKITVYLPGEMYDELDITTSSGNIDLAGGISYGKLELKASSGNIVLIDTNVNDDMDLSTSSGNIKVHKSRANSLSAHCSSGSLSLDDISCTDAELETASGRLSVANAQIARELDGQCHSGGIRLENVNCSSLDLESTSGTVRLEKLIASGNIKISSTSGSISLKGCDAAELDLSAKSGNITGSLLTPKIYVVTTGSGSTHLPEQMSGGICRIKTTSGSVRFD